MKTLALELSSTRGSIAWSAGVGEPVLSEFGNDRKHSGLFFAQLQRAIGELPKPERIVVGLGPGSYAGTRIAIAAAIGLRAATGAALLGICSLRAMAVDAPEYIVVGDARRQSFYFAHVQQRRAIEGPILCSEEELRDRIGAANLPVFTTEPLASFSDAVIAVPSASVLLEIADTEPVPDVAATLEPMYLREPHITQPKRTS